MKKKISIFIIAFFVIMVTLSISGKENCDNCDDYRDSYEYNIDYATMTDMPPKPDMSDRTINIKDGFIGNGDGDGDGDPPSAFSWRNHQGGDWTTPAKNQGRCGSCWAFSAVGMIEAKLNIAQKDPDLDIDLSEQYILSCLPSSGDCSGGWTYNALKYILSTSSQGNYVNGIITEGCMRYQTSDNIRCSQKCEDWKNNLFAIEDFGLYTFPNTPAGKNSLKQLLIDKGPLGVHFYSSDKFENWGKSHHSPDSYYPYETASSTNHAVLLVGYKDDPNIPKGGYWICKNSWGPTFGYNGFFNIEYGSLRIDWDALWVDVPTDFSVDFNYHPQIISNADSIYFDPMYYGQVASFWWDFGDGYYSDLENPIHRFYENGVYTVTLSATNTQGVNSVMSKVIEVPSGNIIAGFDYTPKNPTTQDTLQFIDESIGGGISNWHWNFGDNKRSSLQNPTHQYDNDGKYTVSLTISDGRGTDTIKKDIYINNVKPVADFTYTIDKNKVFFTDDSHDIDGTVVAYEWDFGDGDTSTLKNPAHIFSDRGPFIVTHKVKDNDGDYGEISYQITLDVGPEANFSYTPLNPTINDIIQFTDESIDAISWAWNFDDGFTSNIQNPKHQYTSYGIYYVTLVVTDSNGYSDSNTKKIDIAPPNVPPEASFTITPDKPGASDEITFVDTSVDSDGVIVSWYWDFDDGNTANLKNPKHIYSQVGDYDVSLTVTDDDGDSDTVVQIVSVVPNVPPTASFSYSPSNPTTSNNIQFNDISIDSDGTVKSWLWDFGDNDYSTLKDPLHKYSESGNYDVTLTVTDNDGDSDSYTESIFVDVSKEYLDIEQTKTSYPYYKIYNSYQGAQSFIPEAFTLTKIQVYLKRYDNNNQLSGDLILTLKDSLDGDIITREFVSLDSIPKTWQWIEFDIDDTDVTPGDKYYIILQSSSSSSGEYIEWAKGKYTGYNDGAYYSSNNYGRSWSYFYSYDFCFRIFGM